MYMAAFTPRRRFARPARGGRRMQKVGGAHRYRPDGPAAAPAGGIGAVAQEASEISAGVGQRVSHLKHCTVRPSGVRCASQTMNRKPQHGQVIPMTNKIPFYRQSRDRAIYPR
jgi:hypothetical protein